MKKYINSSLFTRQCVKYIFIQEYQPEVLESSSESDIFLMQRSQEVKKYARELFPEGTDLSLGGLIAGKNLSDITSDILYSRSYGVYYNGAIYDKESNLYSSVDIIVKWLRETYFIVVKSASKIKAPAHINQVGVISKILESYRLKNKKVKLAFLNKDYVRNGELDVEQLFIVSDVTNRAKDNLPLVDNHLYYTNEALQGSKMPSVKMGRHCKIPYQCEAYNYCSRRTKTTAIEKLDFLSDDEKEYFINLGIKDANEIPRDSKLTKEQWIEIDACINDAMNVNKRYIKKFLERLKIDGPITFMDFETIATPIPYFDGTSPYDNLPFQYCVLYGKNSQSIFDVKEFIAVTGKDPREEFIENLVHHIGQTKGPIVVYHEAFEASVLDMLSEKFPQYKNEIVDIKLRLVDLAEPFKEKMYYHPSFKGRYSIKVVLPVLCPELSYDTLKIQNGFAAMQHYERLPYLSPTEKVNTIKALKDYCHTDVRAMVKIVEALRNIN